MHCADPYNALVAGARRRMLARASWIAERQMTLTTELTKHLDIRHPILLAPMGAVSGGRLAAAVTRAGGLGLLGPGYFGADWVEQQFLAADNAPVGIGFITWHMAKNPALLDAALAHKPPVVMLSFGDPTPFISRIKESGAAAIVQVQSVEMAQTAAAAGADIIVAQGSEAGGHGAARGTLGLVPAVIDAVAPLPVVAAGGIADGRGLAAVLALGAAGALIGTRFFASDEALGFPALKQRLLQGSGDDTLRTTIFDVVRKLDWPMPFTGRALANDFTRRWHGKEDELAGALDKENARYITAAGKGDAATVALWAGEGVDLIHAIEPAAVILERMVEEAEAHLGRAAQLVADH
jgi:nitronate monooxygenase